jgi:hypothetical protein
MKIKHLYTVIIITALAWSCRDVLEVPVPYEGPRLSINGFLQPDSAIYLLISENRHILNLTPFRKIENARVELFEEQKSLGLFKSEGQGWYFNGHKPKPGKRYAIEVSTEKHGILEAETIIPSKVLISDVEMFEKIVQRDTAKSVFIEVIIDEPEHETNYYEIVMLANNNDKIYRNDTLIHKQSLYAPVFVEFYGLTRANQIVPVNSPSIMFSDFMLSGKVNLYVPYWQVKDLKRGEFTYMEGKDTYKVLKNDSLFLYLNHVDENYYRYRKTLDLQTLNKGNPFAEPITVFTNIKNGYGIFAGFNASRYEIDVTKIPVLKRE